MMVVIIWYALMQINRLSEYGEPAIMVSVRDSFFDADYEMTTD